MRTSGVRAIVVVLVGVGALALVPGPPAGADGNEAPGAPEAYRSISAGSDHSCAIRFDGAVRCWGANLSGQLGLGDTAGRGDQPGELADLAPIDLGTGRTAMAIVAGGAHTCALLDNAQVKCWGQNAFGQLGLDDTALRGDGPGEMGDSLPTVALGPGRTATAISAGANHTCAILDNRRVKCWGNNFSGQLGQGDIANRGDGPGEMGNLGFVALGAGRTATAITAGEQHTCALLDTRRVVCWGSNDDGRLGRGDASSTIGDGPGEMGANLVRVDLGTGTTATAVGAGGRFTCALLGTGQVKCWGANDDGQLGQGDQVARGSTPESMGAGLPVVPLGGSSTATSLAVGGSHVCTVLDNRDVKCWGRNGDGQLGIGDTQNRGDGADELGTNLPTVSLGRPPHAVTAGGAHSCALLETEQIRCWGFNFFGELGIGDTQYRGDGPGEMGLSLPAVGLLPANDDFADAEVLTGARGTRTGSNANASLEAMEPQHADVPGFQTTIWYSWEAPTSGRTRFVASDTNNNAATILAVYTGSDLTGLTEVVSGRPPVPGDPIQLVFPAEAMQTYHVAVAGVFASGSGRIQLSWATAAPCDGQPVTVALEFGDTPTEGDDVIRGTAGPNSINGRGGADRICGGNGTDTLLGGNGAGADRLFGENGADTLRGGAGSDRLNGGSGNDRLFGDAGFDHLNGGPQRDTCNGGTQPDTQAGCETRTSIP